MKRVQKLPEITDMRSLIKFAQQMCALMRRSQVDIYKTLVGNKQAAKRSRVAMMTLSHMGKLYRRATMKFVDKEKFGD